MSVRAYVVAAGGANYASLRESCRRVGVEVEIGDDPAKLSTATHVILPGVGAAAHAMAALRERGLDRAIAAVTQPLLGICLGLQLMFEQSDEGVSGRSNAAATDCLGLLPGRVRRLPAARSWPHMGWNTLSAIDRGHALLDGIDDDDWFYFVHGYAAPPSDDTLARCEHGDAFSAVVARGNANGVQFHPEKSAAAGRRVLANFFALT